MTTLKICIEFGPAVLLLKPHKVVVADRKKFSWCWFRVPNAWKVNLLKSIVFKPYSENAINLYRSTRKFVGLHWICNIFWLVPDFLNFLALRFFLSHLWQRSIIGKVYRLITKQNIFVECLFDFMFLKNCWYFDCCISSLGPRLFLIHFVPVSQLFPPKLF